ncbi:hypothetical protein NBRC10512_004006 [Rhodotorula toruloides]|uniref:RHTO0S07e06392g1_1 n=2 Tax=Rhodotorula toruloides TaxID=5286 RepID=A0A061AZF8_RHOTO|nr:uncharacterized protein RHTO_02937 [Rhodotorula toruloides NP11]EMS25209.1 hypothetical protein RHTO_02937 [Rhodotorula toruloides NP11]CDR43006.1 RHTO0S07e06392g1_1 [Rhodotorula toruloides]
MSAAPFANASAASRMSEEAVDLICSFARDMYWPDSTRTLRVLMLTSRQFVSSAIRALLYDPTRRLRHGWHSFVDLAFKLSDQPHLGTHVKRLDNLAGLLASVSAWYDHWMLPEQEFVVAIFLRHCPTVRSIGIPADLPSSRWAKELNRLPRLQQVTISQSISDEEEHFFEVAEVLHRVVGLAIPNLRLEDISWDDQDLLQHRQLTLHIADLTIFDCHVGGSRWELLPLSCPQLRRFEFRPWVPPHGLPLALLPATLETLVIGPPVKIGLATVIGSRTDRGRWALPLHALPFLPSLRYAEFSYSWIKHDDLRALASNCPVLEVLRLTNATWHPDEWRNGWMSDARLSAFLPRFSSLRQVNLGYIPDSTELSDDAWRGIPRTRRYCREKNIHLDYAYTSDLPEVGSTDRAQDDTTASPSSVWTDDYDFGPVDDFARRDPPIEFPWELFEDCGLSDYDYGSSSSISSSDEDGDWIPPDWGYRTVGPADFAAAHPPSSPSYLPPSPREEQIVFEEVQTVGWEAEESSEHKGEEELQIDWSGSSDGEDADRAWREFEGAFDDLDALTQQALSSNEELLPSHRLDPNGRLRTAHYGAMQKAAEDAKGYG